MDNRTENIYGVLVDTVYDVPGSQEEEEALDDQRPTAF